MLACLQYVCRELENNGSVSNITWQLHEKSVWVCFTNPSYSVWYSGLPTRSTTVWNSTLPRLLYLWECLGCFSPGQWPRGTDHAMLIYENRCPLTLIFLLIEVTYSRSGWWLWLVCCFCKLELRIFCIFCEKYTFEYNTVKIDPNETVQER
jgi:hypothetical protein